MTATMKPTRSGALLALLAALLFGLVSVAGRASALAPLLLGALAYLLAGIILAPTLRRVHIERRDWPKILAMGLVGGALAPALLFLGLAQATAVDASLLLTLEMVFTAILAAIFLRERAPPLAWVGIALLLASALLVAATSGARQGTTTWMGAALIAGAALGWGLDNTISTKLVGAAAQRGADTPSGASSAYKPHHLIALKGLIGGSAALAFALALGLRPSVPLAEIRFVAYIGILGIGASTVLFYHALQRVGATLTTSLFIPASAIAGVLGGWLLLHEPISWIHGVAAALAVGGILLVARATAGRAPPSPAEEEERA